ncbi:MAG: putative membrane protein YedE/YeeE [Kiritimatiellia bacterium]|jgi:uncharacterized membrane protein YedE/YeeE
MTVTSVIMALFGGALIGLAATVLLLFNGRIAGISGIYSSLLRLPGDAAWRGAFIGGLLVAGLIAAAVMPEALQPPVNRSLMMVAIGGVFVGVGVRIGSGCTSGHGVCGISRLSPRSLVATAVFMSAGFFAATTFRLLFLSGAA